jgi:predicted nucleotidyltransferase
MDMAPPVELSFDRNGRGLIGTMSSIGRGLRSVRIADSPGPIACEHGHMPVPPFADGDLDLQAIAEVCERYGVEDLAVFGSVARGEATSDSDVDLMYRLKPGFRLGFTLNRLEDELATVFGRKVDLVSKRSLHPGLRDVVLREARVLYAAAPKTAPPDGSA